MLFARGHLNLYLSSAPLPSRRRRDLGFPFLPVPPEPLTPGRTKEDLTRGNRSFALLLAVQLCLLSILLIQFSGGTLGRRTHTYDMFEVSAKIRAYELKANVL